MKIFFVSAGLLAIGAASLHAGDTYAPDVTAMDSSKIWSVSGTLRGFYDDNYTTSHIKQASWGFEASPSASIIVPLQQTELGLKYTYGLYYYQARANNGSYPLDQSHQASLWIDHAFTERWEGKVQDTFTVAQDPQLSATPTSVPYRVEGNNIQNVATASVHTEWTMLFSTDLGVQNTLDYYHNHGQTVAGIQAGDPASLAGLLNETAELVYLNLNYEYEPGLTFQVGYQFGLNNYIGGEPIAFNPLNINDIYYSSDLDSYSHYLYVGVTYAITENLSAQAQVGAQYTYNDDLPSWDNQSKSNVTPYANVAATYIYLPGDYAQVGFTQSENSTDTPNTSGNGNITLYEESSVLYASINHQITPFLLASIIAHYQYSDLYGGAGGSQSFYNLGLNLSYTINQYLSAEIGYNFDYLAAGGGQQSYSRDRAYIGMTAAF